MNGIYRKVLSSLCLPAWPVGARARLKSAKLYQWAYTNCIMNGNLFVRVSSYYIYSNGFCPNHTPYTENIEKSRAGFIGGAGSITRKNILLRV